MTMYVLVTKDILKNKIFVQNAKFPNAMNALLQLFVENALIIWFGIIFQ